MRVLRSYGLIGPTKKKHMAPKYRMILNDFK
jgi:hypothetical protein